jgi:hypothetical protein
MQSVDPTVAYYLCSIMVVLGVIILIGAGRQYFKNKK